MSLFPIEHNERKQKKFSKESLPEVLSTHNCARRGFSNLIVLPGYKKVAFVQC